TRATAVKGRGPRPLDDGGPCHVDARDVEASKTSESIREGRSDHQSRGPPDGRPWTMGDDGPVVDMSREDFEGAVSDALDRVPPELTAKMDNVVVLVEDDPPDGEDELLGLYEGV